ncbi:ribosomal protein L22/L17 [Gilbertella persicaria]|uniref:ribosomal protein L22/L17 n=1 Tax=Gilbertella persicaria TaxID=101096 RepID=UPI0022202C2B|nr:ribosomal protein L22/L17 [Gilbertella persicaria]KAI8085887.1 ribosomal protein L22/L17 [Gilbertella persicaria]
MSVLSLTSALKAFQPFKQATSLRVLQSSFSTSVRQLAEQPTPERPQIGASSLFDNVQVETQEKLAQQDETLAEKQYSFSSANFKTSPRKLNMLARQIRNLPIDEAIRQMEFSDKRSAKKILHNLAFARKNATDQKGMQNLVVSQAWVGKGRYIMRIKPHGRGQFGVMHHKQAHIKFILKEAETKSTDKADRRNIRGWKNSKKTWTQLDETKPIYNPKPFYNW